MVEIPELPIATTHSTVPSVRRPRAAVAASRAAAALLAGAALLALAGCQTTVDPATRKPTASKAETMGTAGAVQGALVCGVAAALGGGNGQQIAQTAALCGLAQGIAGFAAGSREDELDRRLLAEFERAGLSVSVRGNTLVLNAERPVGFERGESSPDGRGRSLLQSIAKIVHRFPHREIEVVGHASQDEDSDLGFARAEAVAGILIRAGIAPGRISATGRGSSEPLVTANAEASVYRNRRVEVFFVPPY